MLLLLLIAETVARAPLQSAGQASATVRIERAVRASEEQWSKAPLTNRREIRRKDSNGQWILVRVIEHQ